MRLFRRCQCLKGRSNDERSQPSGKPKMKTYVRIIVERKSEKNAERRTNFFSSITKQDHG